MKNKKVIRFILAIILIIGIIWGINKFIQYKNDQIHKLAEIYNELNTTQTYLFEIEKNEENKTIMAKKDNKTVIDKYSETSHETTLVEQGTTYLILHNREEYYIYNQNNVEQNYLTDGLKDVIDIPYTKGNEKIKGKKYDYEEYQGSTIFLISNTLDTGKEEARTRFYFDGDELAYIKTIVGVKQELLKVSISTEIDDSMFKVPTHYAENSYNQQ